MIKKQISIWFILILFSNSLFAFPTKVIRTPDYQIQTAERFRWDSDVFFTLDKRSDDTGPTLPSIDEGVTYGIFNNNVIGMEVGLDWWEPQPQDNLRSLHAHFKVAVLEDERRPAFALGFYNFGFKANTTDQNIIYLGVGKNFRNVGQFFLAGFSGNQNVLVNDVGEAANRGLILSWVRPMPEISKTMSLAADVQTSDGPLGAISFGGKWNLHTDTVFAVGYNIYNNRTLTRDTVTVQLSLWL